MGVAARRHVVHPARGEGTAASDPPCGQRRSTDRAVHPHRLLGVARAARVEAALAAEPPGQRGSVQPDQADQQRSGGRAGTPGQAMDPAHDAITRARASNPSTSGTSSCVRAAPIVPRATSAMSYPSRTLGASSRHTARSTRRARLRTTAPPTRRPATKATTPEPGATNTTTRSPWNARPDARIRATSFLLVGSSGRQSRPAFGAAAGQDGAAGPRAHPDTKAVSLRPPANVRLVGSFGHRPILSVVRAERFATSAGCGRTGRVYRSPIRRRRAGESAPKRARRQGAAEGPVL
jgi:hypothetical protein